MNKKEIRELLIAYNEYISGLIYMGFEPDNHTIDKFIRDVILRNDEKDLQDLKESMKITEEYF